MSIKKPKMNIKKLLLIVLGFVFLILGVIGIVLPLLPTTPLVLLSALCFSKSSKRLEAMLLKIRIFGPFIENYRTGGGISRLRKAVSIAYLWLGLATSMIVIRTTLIYIVLSIVGIGVTIHLLLIKTRR